MTLFVKNLYSAAIAFLLLLPASVEAQNLNSLTLQKKLDSLRVAGNFPGLSMAVVYQDNSSAVFTSGLNDKEKNTALKPSDMFMQGSTGKTYVSALAMQLLSEKKLTLDAKVSEFLQKYEWFKYIPNSDDVTVRMIMNHSSGIMRYEFKDAFTKTLTSNPDKKWKPEELLSYVLDEKAPFKAGEGWDYSDTNYILLGMIIEEITGKPLNESIRKRILQPLKLKNTLPSDQRQLKGLAQGYAGEGNEFGGKDKVIDEKGLFIINPQFEWAGGGYYSTTEDLARWGKYLYEGRAFDPDLLPILLQAVPAKLGRGTSYGLGVIIRQTSAGIAQGHSGFFPGYLTEMYYFPDHKISIAVQANSSDFKKIRMNTLKVLTEMVQTIVKLDQGTKNKF